MGKWISMDEKTPDTDDWIIVYGPGLGVFMAYPLVNSRYFGDDGSTYECRELTHWQPLPSPPEPVSEHA